MIPGRWIAITLAALVACDRSAPKDDGSAVVEREQIGDTMIVRTVSGSVWGDTARVVEDLRIGALEGRPEVNFGRIMDIEHGRDGSLFIYDNQAMEIRQFDSTGAFVRTIGRRGQGPGEHTRLGGLGILRDGRLISYDTQNARVTRYSATDDSTESWPLRFVPGTVIGSIGHRTVAVDTADRIMLQMNLRERQAERWLTKVAFFRVTPGDSTADTLFAPMFPPAEPSVRLGPRGMWSTHPHGYFIAGTNDRYSFDLLRPEGVLRIQRAVSPPEFEADERAELEAEIEAMGPDYSVTYGTGAQPVVTYGDMPTLAKVKPHFRQIVADDDGRIWVLLHTRARKTTEPEQPPAPPPGPPQPGMPVPKQRPARYWREPVVYDVFEPTGRYLGPVAVPDGVALYGMRGDRAWGTVRGESDEEYVVRFRLQLPASARIR